MTTEHDPFGSRIHLLDMLIFKSKLFNYQGELKRSSMGPWQPKFYSSMSKTSSESEHLGQKVRLGVPQIFVYLEVSIDEGFSIAGWLIINRNILSKWMTWGYPYFGKLSFRLGDPTLTHPQSFLTAS